jgi:hypothetical protein
MVNIKGEAGLPGYTADLLIVGLATTGGGVIVNAAATCELSCPVRNDFALTVAELVKVNGAL